MSELTALMSQRDDLLAKIRTIESKCEGIENENNARCLQELNLKQAKLVSQKNELSAQLNDVQNKLSSLAKEISELSGTGVDKILDAIKNQRWYFIKNKPKVLFDRDTGLLWANLDYYNVCKDEYFNLYVNSEDYSSAVEAYDFDGFGSWNLPRKNQVIKLVNDYSFPFMFDKSGDSHRIKRIDGNTINYLRISDEYQRSISIVNTAGLYPVGLYKIYTSSNAWLPCSTALIENSDYEKNVDPSNNVYTEKERLQFTLDLFVENGLQPVFDDEDISELYLKIYFEKPALIDQLQKIQKEIDKASKITLLTSDFDYKALLLKYDIPSINSSVLKYSEAVINWTDELIEKTEYFELSNSSVIDELSSLTDKLVSDDKSENENADDETETNFFKQVNDIRKLFSADFDVVKEKLAKYRKQAELLKKEIELSVVSDSPITQLAEIEKRNRVSFEMIAEHSADIVKKELLKLEFFENNRNTVEKLITVVEEWKTEIKSFLPDSEKFITFTENCKSKKTKPDQILSYFIKWSSLRNRVPVLLYSIIERYKHTEMKLSKEDDLSTPEQLIALLGNYMTSVDDLFLDKSKNDLKTLGTFLDLEAELYKLTIKLRESVKYTVFNCSSVSDRLFIINLLDNNLYNVQMNSIEEYFKELNTAIPVDDMKIIKEIKARREDLFLKSEESYDEQCSEKLQLFGKLIENLKKL